MQQLVDNKEPNSWYDVVKGVMVVVAHGPTLNTVVLILS